MVFKIIIHTKPVHATWHVHWIKNVHSRSNLHASFCILFREGFCSLFVCWVSLKKHVPHPSLQAPPPCLVAQLVWDQKELCKQPLKTVMLRMTPSLYYSVFYTKPNLACCHEGIMQPMVSNDACCYWAALKKSKTSQMFHRELNRHGSPL